MNIEYQGLASQSDLTAPDEALRMVLEVARPLAPQCISLESARGRRLAENVVADRDYPPFHRAMMDGYAVSLASEGDRNRVRVVGQVAAGQAGARQLEPGECVEIMTGAECPSGTQAVIPFEQSIRDGEFTRLPVGIQPHQHMALRGSECRAQSVLLQVGDLVTSLAVGVLASVGRREVLVVPRPTLGIITTGGELVSGAERPGLAQIRDSNGPMLAALATAWGVPPARVSHADDDSDAIVAAFAAMQDCDVVVLTGGVSAGRYDLVPDAVRRMGGEIRFHKVRQKPGKPMLCATHGHQLVFGLPGNPLAAHLCFHRYVSTALRRLGGHSAATVPRAVGTLAESVQANDLRTWFVLGRAVPRRETGEGWRLQPLPGQSSADLFAASQANCYIEVPPGIDMRKAGDRLTFEWLVDASVELC